MKTVLCPACPFSRPHTHTHTHTHTHSHTHLDAHKLVATLTFCKSKLDIAMPSPPPSPSFRDGKVSNWLLLLFLKYSICKLCKNILQPINCLTLRDGGQCQKFFEDGGKIFCKGSSVRSFAFFLFKIAIKKLSLLETLIFHNTKIAASCVCVCMCMVRCVCVCLGGSECLCVCVKIQIWDSRAQLTVQANFGNFPCHPPFCLSQDSRTWSRFLRRFRSDLTRSLLNLKIELGAT